MLPSGKIIYRNTSEINLWQCWRARSLGLDYFRFGCPLPETLNLGSSESPKVSLRLWTKPCRRPWVFKVYRLALHWWVSPANRSCTVEIHLPGTQFEEVLAPREGLCRENKKCQSGVWKYFLYLIHSGASLHAIDSMINKLMLILK